ncbi:hypothetical protein Tco_0644081, partial [Tanacetum coccineum]
IASPPTSPTVDTPASIASTAAPSACNAVHLPEAMAVVRRCGPTVV